MSYFVVTPASKAESQLLAALFKQMRVKAKEVVAEAPPAMPRRRAKKVIGSPEFIPKTAVEEMLLEAVLEFKEILAGRKQALTLDEFWAEVHAD